MIQFHVNGVKFGASESEQEHIIAHTAKGLLSQRIVECRCGILVELSLTQTRKEAIISHIFQTAWSDLDLPIVSSAQDLSEAAEKVFLISEYGATFLTGGDLRNIENCEEVLETNGALKIFLTSSPDSE